MTTTSGTGPTPGSGGSGTKAPMPPAYPNFVVFAEKWLLPFVNVRLAEANREQTYTWCRQWWRHRAVSVRIAHLHAAFEAARRSRSGSTVSTYLTSHVDAHFRVILDAANGPLHRCTRAKHVALPSLSADPVPPGWFGARPKPTTGNQTTDDGQGEGEKKKTPPRFGHYADWVEHWLLPVTAVKVTANHREGQYTWCRQWWDHHGVAVRFAALHAVFEAARLADDKTAISTLFVSHIDPHLRVILDAAQGPLHRCSPDRHVPQPGLPTTTVAPNWFGLSGRPVPIEDLGFGPDFRSLRPATGT
ncbi:DUF4913 domain-containing protein [Nocardia mexicana]|uniref:Uncharacterized protein DUF4913 n=1 Tax=Nocardia mexicana TaxID=279262 RepID=A0A370GK18_9NOCA|nr:DUF4913 domain-containing protein [Nocardia mexicana]RDI43566.1 uncharacterized protein DUF4913 [Nocardia mexicana]